MSTHPANDTASSLPGSGSRTLHLVGKLEHGQTTETLAPKADTSGGLDWSTPEQAGNWQPRGPFRGGLSKRLLDVLAGITLGLACLPVMLFVVVLLWRRGGAVFYRHKRIGRGGVPFECLKFRTMVADADRVLSEILERDPQLKAEWVRDRKLKKDPRVTSVGRMLRRTSLDELPQLWNVVRGDMSLVGPRPVVREELLRYGRNVGDYLSVRPGITGLWQVTGRNDTEYHRRVELDIHYVRHQNLFLDLWILAKTVLVVISRTGAY